MFGTKGPVCQSCGMPMDRDKGGGGTNQDSTHSLEYCSNCYKDGKFTLEHISVEQMQERVQEKLKEMHIPKFLRPLFTKNIPKLKRWTTE